MRNLKAKKFLKGMANLKIKKNKIEKALHKIHKMKDKGIDQIIEDKFKKAQKTKMEKKNHDIFTFKKKLKMSLSSLIT